MINSDFWVKCMEIKDFGTSPIVIDVEDAAKHNTNFRTAIWTGDHLQVTLMSINVKDDIGLEVHDDTDQFILVVDGKGRTMMGKTKDRLDFQVDIDDGYAAIVPAGTWHNIVNTGRKPLKLISIYAPPHHPTGTIHVTKEDSDY